MNEPLKQKIEFMLAWNADLLDRLRHELQDYQKRNDYLNCIKLEAEIVAVARVVKELNRALGNI